MKLYSVERENTAELQVAEEEIPLENSAATNLLLERLRRLNAAATSNSIVQNATPATKVSRASAGYFRQAVSSSVKDFQQNARKKKSVAGRSIVPEPVAETTGEISQVCEVAVNDEKMLGSADVPFVMGSGPALPSEEKLFIAVSVDEIALESATYSMEVPVAAATDPPATISAGVKDVLSGEQLKSALLTKDELVADAVVSAEESKAPTGASPIPLPHASAKPVDPRALADLQLNIDIMNRLSYCHLRTYKANEIVLEASLTASTAAVIQFALSFGANLAHNTMSIDRIHVELEIKADSQTSPVAMLENAIAKNYFGAFMCSDDRQGPLSNYTLDAITDSKHLIPLVRKVSTL